MPDDEAGVRPHLDPVDPEPGDRGEPLGDGAVLGRPDGGDTDFGGPRDDLTPVGIVDDVGVGRRAGVAA